MAIKRAGHVLVAAADGHQPSIPRSRDRLDGIGDDLARHQRILHALRPHRNAVGNGDGVEDDGLAAGAIGPASASRASWSMCALQGVTMLQVEAMPMIGFLKSSS
jgi:hypothetical protein